jgi:hypothetical protein
MANCKGIAVTARLRYAEVMHGEPGLRQLIDALEPQVRQVVDGHILPHAWVPMDVFVAVNVAADRLFGKGDLRLCQDMGAWAADRNLPKLFRLFYKLGSPAFVLTNAPKLWSAHYDSGHLEVVRKGEKSLELSVCEFAVPHRAHCLSVLGWVGKSIEISGGTLTRAEEVTCRTTGGKACTMAVQWS